MWVYSIVFIKFLVGNLNFIVTDSSQPKIFGSKIENRKSGKVPVGTFGLYTNGQFTAKNIRFKNRKIENLVKFPLGNHRISL